MDKYLLIYPINQNLYSKPIIKMKLICVLILVIFNSLISFSQIDSPLYSVAQSPWDQSLGNHRAVLKVEKAASAVKLDILWRRHDLHPEKKRFIIKEAKSGEQIPNIFVVEASNERCELVFGPVKNPGTYYFYYLPYQVQEEYGFYNKDYLKPRKKPSPQWVAENKLEEESGRTSLAEARLSEIQARTNFDSFYPMEVIALEIEKEALKQQFKEDFLIFPESRKFPIRMKDEIPVRWIQNRPSNRFAANAQKNEYFAFQLGIYASQKISVI